MMLGAEDLGLPRLGAGVGSSFAGAGVGRREPAASAAPPRRRAVTGLAAALEVFFLGAGAMAMLLVRADEAV